MQRPFLSRKYESKTIEFQGVYDETLRIYYNMTGSVHVYKTIFVLMFRKISGTASSGTLKLYRNNQLVDTRTFYDNSSIRIDVYIDTNRQYDNYHLVLTSNMDTLWNFTWSALYLVKIDKDLLNDPNTKQLYLRPYNPTTEYRITIGSYNTAYNWYLPLPVLIDYVINDIFNDATTLYIDIAYNNLGPFYLHIIINGGDIPVYVPLTNEELTKSIGIGLAASDIISCLSHDGVIPVSIYVEPIGEYNPAGSASISLHYWSPKPYIEIPVRPVINLTGVINHYFFSSLLYKDSTYWTSGNYISLAKLNEVLSAMESGASVFTGSTSLSINLSNEPIPVPSDKLFQIVFSHTSVDYWDYANGLSIHYQPNKLKNMVIKMSFSGINGYVDPNSVYAYGIYHGVELIQIKQLPPIISVIVSIFKENRIFRIIGNVLKVVDIFNYAEDLVKEVTAEAFHKYIDNNGLLVLEWDSPMIGGVSEKHLLFKGTVSVMPSSVGVKYVYVTVDISYTYGGIDAVIPCKVYVAKPPT
jgi:hypothetical protein